MTPEVKEQYDRLKAGPQSGYFTLLHHKGPLVEESNNLMERIDYILQEKPEQEHLLRLRHIWPVSETANKAWDEAVARANKARDEAVAPAYKARDEAVARANKARDEAVALAYKARDEAVALAYKARDEAVARAYKEIVALIPDCTWNGGTIFSKDD